MTGEDVIVREAAMIRPGQFPRLSCRTSALYCAPHGISSMATQPTAHDWHLAGARTTVRGQGSKRMSVILGAYWLRSRSST
eukprot:2410586-Pleurochrysis_carterae.AAC.3